MCVCRHCFPMEIHIMYVYLRAGYSESSILYTWNTLCMKVYNTSSNTLKWKEVYLRKEFLSDFA